MDVEIYASLAGLEFKTTFAGFIASDLAFTSWYKGEVRSDESGKGYEIKILRDARCKVGMSLENVR